MTLLTEGKTTLYFRPKFGDQLLTSSKQFVIKNSEGEIMRKQPAVVTRDIIIFGESTLSTKIFALAKSEDIPLHFLDGNGKLMGSVRYDFSKNIFLRAEQFRKHESQKERLTIAKSFIEAKLHNQKTVIQKLRLSPPEIGNNVEKAETLEELLGIEGSGAKIYFELWKTKNVIKNPEFSFSGRWKRPPLDPINAILSFAYSLMHAEILTQILIAGLDPYFGFVHEQKYGHAALVSDFLEIFRGPIDHFVITSLNLREFSKEDFEEETGGIWKFSSTGFQKFFPKWASFLRYDTFWKEKSLVATIEYDIRHFTHFLMGDSDHFSPFKWQK